MVGGAPSTWGGAWRAEPWPVGARNEPASRQVALCRPPLPGRGHQPRRLAVLPLPTQPAHGRGDAGRPRHRREPRDRAAVALKFGQAFANRIRRRLPRAGDKWHLDEVAIKIAGVTHWLWRAVDQTGMVLDVLVQKRRDKRAAKRLLRKLLKRQCRAPRVMITDKLASYGAARKELMPGVEHRRHRGLNNRAGNLYGATRVKCSFSFFPPAPASARVTRWRFGRRRPEGSPPRARGIAPRTCIRW